MKIRVADIRGGGIFQQSEKISAKELGFSNEYDVTFDSDFNIDAAIQRLNSVLIAETTVAVKMSTVCSRCLEPMTLDWKKSFIFDFAVSKETQSVDMNEDIRQEVLLNLPLKLLCTEDCQGICPDCGANLNVEECRCKK